MQLIQGVFLLVLRACVVIASPHFENLRDSFGPDAVPVSFVRQDTTHLSTLVSCPDGLVVVWGFKYHIADTIELCVFAGNSLCPVGFPSCKVEECSTPTTSVQGVHLLCGTRPIEGSVPLQEIFFRSGSPDPPSDTIRASCIGQSPTDELLVILFGFKLTLSTGAPCTTAPVFGECDPGFTGCDYLPECSSETAEFVDVIYVLCVPQPVHLVVSENSLVELDTARFARPTRPSTITCGIGLSLLTGMRLMLANPYPSVSSDGICEYDYGGGCLVRVSELQQDALFFNFQVCVDLDLRGVPGTGPTTDPTNLNTTASPTDLNDIPSDGLDTYTIVVISVFSVVAVFAGVGLTKRAGFVRYLQNKVHNKGSYSSSTDFGPNDSVGRIVTEGPKEHSVFGRMKSKLGLKMQPAVDVIAPTPMTTETATKTKPGQHRDRKQRDGATAAKGGKRNGETQKRNTSKSKDGVDHTTSWYHIKIRRSSAYRSKGLSGRGVSLFNDLNRFASVFKVDKPKVPADLSSMAPKRTVINNTKPKMKARNNTSSRVGFARQSSFDVGSVDSFNIVRDAKSTSPDL